MKRSLALIAALIITAFCMVTVLAEAETYYSVTLDSIQNEYKTGEEFYVKASLGEIKSPDGFIGVGIQIEYDPEMIEALESDKGTAVETFVPDEWKENGEMLENVVTDAEGKQTGRILLNYIAPVQEDGGKASAIRGNDELYVIIKFKSLKPGKTVVKVDGENGYNVCTGYDENGSAVSYAGKGSEIEFTFSGENSGAEESGGAADGERSYTVYYVIVGAAVVIAAAAIIITKLVKKI